MIALLIALAWVVVGVLLAPRHVRSAAVMLAGCKSGWTRATCRRSHGEACEEPLVTPELMASWLVLSVAVWPACAAWFWVWRSSLGKPLPLTPVQRDLLIRRLQKEEDDAVEAERARLEREERKALEKTKHSVRNGGVRELVARVLGDNGYVADHYSDGSTTVFADGQAINPNGHASGCACDDCARHYGWPR